MNRLILVTGASGNIGKRTAELLAEQGETLRLMARNLDKVPSLPNAQVVQGDYEDTTSLKDIFTGVDTAFVVSGFAEPGKRAQLHKNAFDAAAGAGVRHLVYLSSQGASPESKFPWSRDHYQTEQYLKESGIQFTALRDSLYLDLIPQMFGTEGVLRAPAGQGATAFVSREDVAQVVAAVLRSPGDTSATYDVTGPEALTMAEAAKRLSTLVGRELRYEEETVAEGRQSRSASGAPAWEVDTWIGSFEAIAAGEFEQTSDTVLRLTGHQPLMLDTYFTKYPERLASLRSN